MDLLAAHAASPPPAETTTEIRRPHHCCRKVAKLGQVSDNTAFTLNILARLVKTARLQLSSTF